MADLHGVDPRVVEEAGLPSYDAETYRHRLLADLDRAAETKRVPAGLITRWEEALDAPALWRFSTTVTHGPLRGEDVMVDEGEVSGMTGWEHAGVADPARDFSLLWTHAPRQAFDTVFEAYAARREDRPDHHLERRIRLMGEMELAYALLRSRTMGEEELVEYHTAALDTLARDVEDDGSLLPPERRGGITPIDVESPRIIDPSDIEAVGSDDFGEDDVTVEIPIRLRNNGQETTGATHLEDPASQGENLADHGPSHGVQDDTAR